jgi:hypothetical protein
VRLHRSISHDRAEFNGLVAHPLRRRIVAEHGSCAARYIRAPSTHCGSVKFLLLGRNHRAGEQHRLHHRHESRAGVARWSHPRQEWPQPRYDPFAAAISGCFDGRIGRLS